MNHLEYLERLESTGWEERWLVQAAGRPRPHVVWFMRGDFQGDLQKIEAATRNWIGPIHPRLATIESISWHNDHLIIESDDDRGPSYPDAAAQLEDPNDRERWAVAQVIAVADALATMRQRDPKFVHRRLEPERMFVDESGKAKLRAPVRYVEYGERQNYTGAAVVMGAPHWMSPEQAMGKPITPTTDVFALVSLLYYALSGRRPFDTASESMMEVLRDIIMVEPQPLLTKTQGLWDVMARAFVKDASKRFPDPGTFAGELWRCVPDAADYDAVVSDRIVAWRATAPDVARRSEAYKPCRMKWQDLKPTTKPNVYHCHNCREDVVRVDSAAGIIPLIGNCVAYRGGD